VDFAIPTHQFIVSVIVQKKKKKNFFFFFFFFFLKKKKKKKKKKIVSGSNILEIPDEGNNKEIELMETRWHCVSLPPKTEIILPPTSSRSSSRHKPKKQPQPPPQELAMTGDDFDYLRNTCEKKNFQKVFSFFFFLFFFFFFFFFFSFSFSLFLTFKKKPDIDEMSNICKNVT